MAENNPRQELPRNIGISRTSVKPCMRVTPRMSGEIRNNITPDNGAREFWEIPAPVPPPLRWRPGDIDWDMFRTPSMRGENRTPLRWRPGDIDWDMLRTPSMHGENRTPQVLPPPQ